MSQQNHNASYLFEIDGLTTWERLRVVRNFLEDRAWNLNNTSSTPLIDGLLTSRNFGETKQVLVDKIIINADRYSVMYSNILGKFQNLSALLNTVASVTDIKQISW